MYSWYSYTVSPPIWWTAIVQNQSKNPVSSGQLALPISIWNRDWLRQFCPIGDLDSQKLISLCAFYGQLIWNLMVDISEYLKHLQPKYKKLQNIVVRLKAILDPAGQVTKTSFDVHHWIDYALNDNVGSGKITISSMG